MRFPKFLTYGEDDVAYDFPDAQAPREAAPHSDKHGREGNNPPQRQKQSRTTHKRRYKGSHHKANALRAPMGRSK